MQHDQRIRAPALILIVQLLSIAECEIAHMTSSKCSHNRSVHYYIPQYPVVQCPRKNEICLFGGCRLHPIWFHGRCHPVESVFFVWYNIIQISRIRFLPGHEWMAIPAIKIETSYVDDENRKEEK